MPDNPVRTTLRSRVFRIMLIAGTTILAALLILLTVRELTS